MPVGEEYEVWSLALCSFLSFSSSLGKIFSSGPTLKHSESICRYLACLTCELYTNFLFLHILAFVDLSLIHTYFLSEWGNTVLIICTLSHDTVSYQVLKLSCWPAVGSCVYKVVRAVSSNVCNWLWCRTILGQVIVIHILQKFLVFLLYKSEFPWWPDPNTGLNPKLIHSSMKLQELFWHFIVNGGCACSFWHNW